MKKIFLILIVSASVIACQQPEQRYSQSGPEVDLAKGVIASYEAGNWDEMRAAYADDAEIYHNNPDESMSADENVESNKETVAMMSSYGFRTGEDSGDIEMVVTDEGETWVNYWGVWEGTMAANGQKLVIPVHITMQIVDGKVAKEYGYWDTASLVLATQALEAAAAAAEAEESEGSGEM